MSPGILPGAGRHCNRRRESSIPTSDSRGPQIFSNRQSRVVELAAINVPTLSPRMARWMLPSLR